MFLLLIQLDLCISNAIVKTGIGFSAGVVFSVLLLKRRAWPVWLGTGFGLGAGYTDCERSFNPVSVPGVRLIPAAVAGYEVPESQFGRVQQRVGELFGKARSEAQDKVSRDPRVPESASEVGQAAHNRFTELSEKGRQAVQHQVSGLQNAAHDVTAKAQVKGHELAEALRDAEHRLDDKVRRV